MYGGSVHKRYGYCPSACTPDCSTNANLFAGDMSFGDRRGADE
jgi:hypothetical protein